MLERELLVLVDGLDLLNELLQLLPPVLGRPGEVLLDDDARVLQDL